MTKNQIQFMEDMIANGIDVGSMENKYGEYGPSVQCSRMDADDVKSCTQVKCLTDRVTEGDVLIYPLAPHFGP